VGSTAVRFCDDVLLFFAIAVGLLISTLQTYGAGKKITILRFPAMRKSMGRLNLIDAPDCGTLRHCDRIE
jgi:hypothetical protein